MRLKIIGSGSSGNTYLLIGESGTLVVDAGMSFAKVKEAVDFDISGIVGVCVSHSHLDHSKYIKDYLKAGIDVFSSQDCFDELGLKHHRLHAMETKKAYIIDGFKVMPFDLKHDVRNLGFIVDNKESGRFCYISDTHYCPYTFKGLNNILLEINYDIKLVDRKLVEGSYNYFIRNRSLQNHMELQTAKSFLAANDLSAVNSIVLIHLSDNGSDAGRFVSEIKELTGKNVEVAVPGLEIDFNLHPF